MRGAFAADGTRAESTHHVGSMTQNGARSVRIDVGMWRVDRTEGEDELCASGTAMPDRAR